MKKSEDKQVFVGYTAGYGGQFFSALLHNAYIDKSYHVIPFENELNEYKYTQSSEVFFKVESLLKMYSSNELQYEHYNMDSPLYSFFEEVKKDFDKLYDSDVKIFHSNLCSFIKTSVPSAKRPIILCGHYFKEHHDFSIRNAFEDVVFLLLMASSEKHRYLFKLMFNIKKRNFDHPKFIRWYLDSRYFKYPAHPTPFDSCVPIEAGKLFLSTDDEYFNKMQDTLSTALEKKIIVDKDVVMDYSDSNIKLLNNFLCINVEKTSFEDLKAATVRKLKSLL